MHCWSISCTGLCCKPPLPCRRHRAAPRAHCSTQPSTSTATCIPPLPFSSPIQKYSSSRWDRLPSTFPACSCFSPTLARAATIPTYSKPFPCPVNSKGRGLALGTNSPQRFRDRELPGGWKTTCEVILGAEIGLIWLNQTIREKRGRALKEHSSL